MTELLQHVIDQLRNVPTGDQDNVAREIAEILEEYPTTDELAAIADGRAQFERGDYVTYSGSMKWGLLLANRARRALKRASHTELARIRSELNAMTDDPYSGDTKMLKGSGAHFAAGSVNGG